MLKNIVLLTHKYWGETEAGGISYTHYPIVNTLISSNISDKVHVIYSADNILENVNSINPEVIIIALAYYLTPTILSNIKSDNPTVKIITILFDANDPTIYSGEYNFDKYVDRYTLLDLDNINDMPTPSKCSFAPLPQDFNLYNDPGYDRNLDAIFCGGFSNFFNRDYLFTEANNTYGANISVIGGKIPSEVFTYTDYANLYKTCKIAINTSFNIKRNIYTLKGRVQESMLCGPLLIDNESSLMNRFFKPYIHYVPFNDNDPCDLAYKIKYYLENSEERLTISKCGTARAREVFDPLSFWKSRMSELGFFN